jgi:NADPH:quinone reductase-like Zn-dependent oxidoreductase
MRAIRQQSLGGPEVLELGTVPRPEPQLTELLVRACAAANRRQRHRHPGRA